MQFTLSAAALAAIVPYVLAHGSISSVSVGGVSYPQPAGAWPYQPGTFAQWNANNLDNGFVASDATSLASSDVACHKAAVPGKGSITIAAGSPITLTWNTWPDTHKGPVTNALAKVDSFASATAASLKFFQFTADGFIDKSLPNGGKWATDVLIANKFSQTVTIPKSLAPGNYVLRHQILALHAAGSPGGAQLYPQCINLVVTGSGTASPAGTSPNTWYKTTDPGILFNLYSFTSYTIPGPATTAISKREVEFTA